MMWGKSNDKGQLKDIIMPLIAAIITVALLYFGGVWTPFAYP